MPSEKISKFIDEVKSLSVMELAELVKALETEFGVSAAAMTSIAWLRAATACGVFSIAATTA